MLKTYVKNERGMAALVALLLVGMLTLIGLAAISTSDDEVQVAGNKWQETKAFYAAESGLDKAVSDLMAHYDTANSVPGTMPSGTDDVNDCSVVYNTVDEGAATAQVIAAGAQAGLHALVKKYAVTSTASNTDENANVTLRETFESAVCPLFQFAVFYGNDLEIAPGPAMTLLGRVHSNGNLWIQAGNTLKMDSYVTSSGDIIHGRKGPGSIDNGDVQIKDGTGVYKSMKLGSGWLEHSYSDWYDSSVARWNGRVQDSDHGQGELNVPITGGGDPHKLIERATSNPDSYENKATLKFINGTAFQLQSGSWVDVTAAMTAAGVITYTNNKFTDQREGKVADVTDIDVDKLYKAGYAPSNGVIYFSDKRAGEDFPALRLKNGAELGAPLTLASENPVYTQGNFNSTKKKAAAILADAYTCLSGSWDDAKSALTKTDRTASATTVNVCYATGNVNTTSTIYNGGFENLLRFLEDWTNKTNTWTGSAVCLWNSTQATGTWNGTYYNPPNRTWSYDSMLDNPNNIPPESPVIRVFHRTGWSQEHVGL
ncbi:hypothetical protein C3F09_11325 [candidate division GN15 bacterium]|uniref:Type 4 fimbrial biogenesis protein PilX N-terminal domain-containing protein n=1 Tax=candidate division GN15 bacterium TaxID=2072418 RepID=A0A855WYQ7_9BACT|nr:MAG: hypothetical protein C3F09_11325 [candidate division GN15 bacterium]